MTITQLHYVLAVAEYQNFTKAAQKVFVTQPTLSMQIQKLEEELEVQIFDRTKNEVKVGVAFITIGKALNSNDRWKAKCSQCQEYITTH